MKYQYLIRSLVFSVFLLVPSLSWAMCESHQSPGVCGSLDGANYACIATEPHWRLCTGDTSLSHISSSECTGPGDCSFTVYCCSKTESAILRYEMEQAVEAINSLDNSKTSNSSSAR